MLMFPVSIQLMSPASGDLLKVQYATQLPGRFHSINVPSEWGPKLLKLRGLSLDVSIQLMSPASGDHTFLPTSLTLSIHSQVSFHSINVPSEWGLDAAADGSLVAPMFPFN